MGNSNGARPLQKAGLPSHNSSRPDGSRRIDSWAPRGLTCAVSAPELTVSQALSSDIRVPYVRLSGAATDRLLIRCSIVRFDRAPAHGPACKTLGRKPVTSRTEERIRELRGKGLGK